MLVGSIAFKLSRAYFDKSNAGTVVWVHVGMNLEHEARKAFFVRIDGSFFSIDRAGRWSDFHKTVQKFLHTESIQRRAKEHRSHFAFEIGFGVEFGINALD